MVPQMPRFEKVEERHGRRQLSVVFTTRNPVFIASRISVMLAICAKCAGGKLSLVCVETHTLT